MTAPEAGEQSSGTAQHRRTPRVIALVGKKRTGKDTVANHLVQHYGYTNAKFADPLKRAVQGLFGFTDEQIEVTKEVVDPLWGVTPRQVMQFIGCDVVQHQFQTLLPTIGRGFFVKSLLSRYRTERIVISDMRFLHEYDAIRALEDAVIIKLERPSVDDGDSHISEKEVDAIHPQYVIQNTGTVGDLLKRVDAIVSLF